MIGLYIRDLPKVILRLPARACATRNDRIKNSNEHAGGPPGANILDGHGGVTAPGSKSLASVDDISGIYGSG